MATFKFTGLGAGSALTDSANLQQVQYGFGSFLTSVAGTNTVTATATPTPAYTVGQRFTFIPAVTNTSAVTLNISSVGAGAVQLDGGALTGGELEAGTPVTVYVTAATPVFEILTGLSRATQAQQETATSVNVAVTPGRQQYHPSAAKGWVLFDSAGAIQESYNVTSVNRDSAGTFTITWATDFATATYAIVVTAIFDSAASTATTFVGQVQSTSKAVGAVVVKTLRVSDGAPIDTTFTSVVAYGDQ